MPLRVIKPGTARASNIQQFLFTDTPGGVPPAASAAKPAPVNAGVKAPAPAEQKPAVDLASIEKTAYENGFKQGENAGKEIAEQKIVAVMKRYSESILEVGRLRSSLYPQIEHEVVRLALEVAKKIIHREIHIDKDVIRTLVHVALSHVAEKSSVTIHLNPVDYGFLLEERAELSQNEGRDVSLLADKSIERGGCLIQTECGDIDARIEEKFREVEQSFFEGAK
jgi:flagellar assembly protein FliH